MSFFKKNDDSSINVKVTLEDVRRLNERLMGNEPPIKLTAEQAALFERVKQVCLPVTDGPELQRIVRKAREVSSFSL